MRSEMAKPEAQPRKIGAAWTLALLLSLVAASANGAWAAAQNQQLSDALKANRPAGGEYFGLYLINKKIGYVFTDLTLVPGSPTKARATSEFVFKANLSNKVSERLHKEVRTYEAKPGGRLLSFRIEDSGDGGAQVLIGTLTSTGVRVIRKRPGQAEQILNLPPSPETIEDADQARVAIHRNQPVEGFILDGQDLGSYKVKTTVEPSQQRLIHGVTVRLHRAITTSEKEKVPTDIYVAANGEMVQLDFGEQMKAVAEPESVAKRLDKVEVFGLTRVTLPTRLPELAREVPGQLALVLTGLPDKFRRDTYRQKFKKLSDSQVEVTISAAPPKHEAPVAFPLSDPNGGEYLKSTIIVESDSPEIQRQAKKIVSGEKDAYAAAKKIVSWVSSHMKKDYGASADRATDVLRQMKGDCTEHSLLSVSLLRAVGIPSKRVDGVVYMVTEDGVPALYWHEWVEAYVGEWTQLDPTFGQPVADATHFAVGEEANAEITPLIGQLKVVEVR
jgi:transglutaminase-like putative cysteine protease